MHLIISVGDEDFRTNIADHLCFVKKEFKKHFPELFGNNQIFSRVK